MDFDIIGLLMLLWIVLKSFKDGKKSKEEFGKQQEEKTKSTLFKERKSGTKGTTLTMEEIENAPPKRRNSFPSWFPFPFPLEIEEMQPEKKKRTKPKPKPKSKQNVPSVERTKAFIGDTSVQTKKPVVENIVLNEAIRTQKNQPLQREDLVKGIIWSEILGPPKAKRRIERKV